MIRTIIAAVALLGCMSANAAGDAEAGQAKSGTCTACHGTDGNSVNSIWPKLAGQHPTYLARQLKLYKNGC